MLLVFIFIFDVLIGLLVVSHVGIIFISLLYDIKHPFSCSFAIHMSPLIKLCSNPVPILKIEFSFLLLSLRYKKVQFIILFFCTSTFIILFKKF